MRTVLLVALLISASVMAEIREYTVGDEVRLYDTDCYAKAKDHVVLGPQGFSYVVGARPEECRVRGRFFEARLRKRDLNAPAIVATFRYGWTTEEQANRTKARLESGYDNSLGLNNQIAEVVSKDF